MTIEERLNQLEARVGKNDELVRELRESFTVIAGLERRQSAQLKDHAEWLVEQDRAFVRHKEAIADIDKRITDLVSGMGEFIRQMRTLQLPR